MQNNKLNYEDIILQNNLKISETISSSQINELIDYSNSDKLIMLFTTDNIRFKNRKSYDKWLSKKRKIYTLINEKDSLCGIIWFGEKIIPQNRYYLQNINLTDYGLTFAIRIYEEIRGKKLANIFMQAAWERFTKTQDYLKIKSKGLWLETKNENIRAIKTYEKFGFTKISNSNKEGLITMIYPNIM